MDKATPTPASVDSVMRAAKAYGNALGCSATDTRELQAVLRAEVERLAARPAPTDDAMWDQTLKERDNYHKWADKLAEGIAAHLGIEIGEHTAGMGSAESNNPWANALEAIHSVDQPVCPNCGGSGCVQQMTGHLGPDDYEETVDCPHCNGNQTLEAAYQGVVKLLDGERAAHSRTRGIIWGWSSSRSEVNAVQHKLGNILEHLKPSNIAWVGDRLRDLIASAVAQPPAAAQSAPLAQQAREYPPLPEHGLNTLALNVQRGGAGVGTETILAVAQLMRAYVDADRAVAQVEPPSMPSSEWLAEARAIASDYSDKEVMRRMLDHLSKRVTADAGVIPADGEVRNGSPTDESAS